MLTFYPFLSLVAKKEGQVEKVLSTLLVQDPPAFDLPWGGMLTAPRLTDDSSSLSPAAPEALTLNMDLIPEKGTQEFRGKGLDSDQQLRSVSPSSLVLWDHLIFWRKPGGLPRFSVGIWGILPHPHSVASLGCQEFSKTPPEVDRGRHRETHLLPQVGPRVIHIDFLGVVTNEIEGTIQGSTAWRGQVFGQER